MSFLKKKSFALCAAMGVGCAWALTAALLLPFAWAIRSQTIPEEAGWLCASLSAGLAVLVPTAVIARVRGRQALATGGALAGGYTALAALACALGGKGSAFGMWLAALAAAAFAGGLVGAMVSVRQNAHRKKRR